jgi:hypothetical protein
MEGGETEGRDGAGTFLKWDESTRSALVFFVLTAKMPRLQKSTRMASCSNTVEALRTQELLRLEDRTESRLEAMLDRSAL